jgi:Na+-driven multidrug efflux pump
MGGDIAVRTGALLLAFTLAGAVVARSGAPSLAAHQIAFQLFVFLALVLDAIAIAGQIIVGRALGAGDPAQARFAARRMIGWSVAAGSVFALVLLALGGVLPRLFSPDPAVLDRAALLWPLFALMQPVGGAVFALDGILIGAGDSRYLKWSMVFAAGAVFAPIAALSLALGWGLVGVWWGLNALMVARLATLGARFRGGRWAVVGVGWLCPNGGRGQGEGSAPVRRRPPRAAGGEPPRGGGGGLREAMRPSTRCSTSSPRSWPCSGARRAS